MPLRMIAKDLYRLQQEVEALEARLKSEPPEGREAVKDQLRKVRAERNRMRKVLEGNKEPPTYRVAR